MEKKMSFDYYMIKNYDELTDYEQREVFGEINTFMKFYHKYNHLDFCTDPDLIVEEAKKHLYLFNFDDELVGRCANYSDSTWNNYDRTKCLGFVPFEELNLSVAKGKK